MNSPNTSPAPPPPEWLLELHAQGRSVAWLAERVGVSRTYLHDVAAGRKRASAELVAAIRAQLHVPDRLSATREYAADRARWQRIARLARELAAAIEEADARAVTLAVQLAETDDTPE